MDISCCGLNASWNSIARVFFYIYVNIDIFWDIQISSQCGPRTPSPPRSQIHHPVPLEAGDVERLKVLKNPDGTTKGVGFVTFRTEEQADSAESWHTGWHSVDSVAPMLFATVVSIIFAYHLYYLFSLSLFVCMAFTCRLYIYIYIVDICIYIYYIVIDIFIYKYI